MNLKNKKLNNLDVLNDYIPLPQSYEEVINSLEMVSELDREDCALIIELFYSQSLQLLENARTMDQDLKNEHIGVIFHKLKGSSGNARVTSIMQLAMEGEMACKENRMDSVDSLLNQIEFHLDFLIKR